MTNSVIIPLALFEDRWISGPRKGGLTFRMGYRRSPTYSTRKFCHLEFAWKYSILGCSVPNHEITRYEVYETCFYPRFHSFIHSSLIRIHCSSLLGIPNDTCWPQTSV